MKRLERGPRPTGTQSLIRQYLFAMSLSGSTVIIYDHYLQRNAQSVTENASQYACTEC